MTKQIYANFMKNKINKRIKVNKFKIKKRNFRLVNT